MASSTAAVPPKQQPAPVQIISPDQKGAESSQVLQALLNQLAKVGFLCWLIAWGLSCTLTRLLHVLCCIVLLELYSVLAGTSKSFWLNLPLAALLIASAYWVFVQVNDRAKEQSRLKPAKQIEAAATFVFPSPGPSGYKPEGKWKEQVNSPMVVEAWEMLSGSIVQEVEVCSFVSQTCKGQWW